MDAVFVEMSSFTKHRARYLGDEYYAALQQALLNNPRKGDTITGTGGLRKIRWADSWRGKGQRGGIRVIYYYFDEGDQFWMFLVYSKGELADLTQAQKKVFRAALENEIKLRRSK